MKKRLFILVVLIIASAASAAGELKNEVYTIRTVDADTVVITHKDGGDWTFDLSFCVLFSDADPKPAPRPGEVDNVSYNVITWENKDLKAPAGQTANRKDFIAVGDGFDPSILQGSKSSRTPNLFYAAPQIYINAENVQASTTAFKYTFADNPAFQFGAMLTLPSGTEPPILRYLFTPKKAGYYSIGYIGAPQYQLDELDEIFQPMLWQEKRFPQTSIMTLAYRCTVPSTFITKDGVALGVVADPKEFPFDELPLVDNSRFGVALHNKDHLAQPMLFAPVLGGKSSKMQPGQRFSFTLRPVIIKGDSTIAFEHVARSMYGV